MKDKLKKYQDFIKEKLGEEYVSDDQQLTLLLIKSLEVKYNIVIFTLLIMFQDGLHKHCDTLKPNLDDQITYAINKLEGAYNDVLSDGDRVTRYQKEMPIEYLDCIAQVRFGICFAARSFYEYYCNLDALKKLQRSTKEQLERLRCTVQKIIENGVIKEPHNFLIKQILREYGFPYLYNLNSLPEFNWLAPKSKAKVLIY